MRGVSRAMHIAAGVLVFATGLSPSVTAAAETPTGGEPVATVSGECTFLNSVFVPTQGVHAWIGIDATATPGSPLNPVVASSVTCRIAENGSEAGFTGPGESWSSTGLLRVHAVPSPTLCVNASAFLLDGEVVNADEKCEPF